MLNTFLKPLAHRGVVSALEHVFALHAGITGTRALFPIPPDGDAAWGRGRLSVRGGWRFLHLEGSPREMGLQHGRLLGPLIHTLLEAYLGGIRTFRRLTMDDLLRRGRTLEPFIPEPFLEEMHAIAEGAGLRYEEILVGHTFLESVQAVNCSCFAAFGDYTRTGEMIFGRNLDFLSMGVAHRCGVVVFAKPDRGIPFVSISWPGWCGTLTAVNLNGLGIGPLNVGAMGRGLAGMPYVVMFRQMAQECSTCGEAENLLRRVPRTYGNNVLLTQTRPERLAVVAEYHHHEVAVRHPRPGRHGIAATNHFRLLGRAEEWPEHIGYRRYPLIGQIMDQYRGRIDLRTPILSDPRIFLQNSLHTLLAAPESRTIRVSLGRMPAAEEGYRTFRYDENGIILE